MSRLPPHPPLAQHYGSEAAREPFVRTLFDRGAPSYDQIDAVFSFGTGPRYRREALMRSGLAPGQRMLDVAIGTGLVAREALRILGRAEDLVGLDVSPGMLREARSLGLPLVQAKAEAIPLADASMDLVTVGYALRHFADLGAAFAEFRRVLRPGGGVLLLEIDHPESAFGQAALRFYLGHVVPSLSRWLGGGRDARRMMRYFWDTIDACVPAAAIEEALAGAGFTEVRCEIQLGIFRAYRAKAPLAA
ncbi:demethylmenaquinone methyltransferase/2-methoxy-6-polyprenyl-1,4-benzoquinol methylase [Roseomonas alkaliterrae]|uniref:Demethylmenaquinone methyltransferase/2-methoxy-6-polyprenyl-1,4-benzoquinol methylase n=1 Tax=Neoroseomonas alkaliterrae TaxID=1452450 RepID=A0A840XI95_9PROT|nr:class I SAM-dependent methyltransferase [Neoroseomonas alkaliterrae]MBB5688168.1 demethylmenaquinone methyltransferase/2-methoxy-6-polyprenyl-1,4-benzoquinol methylase [Neoroseomonas alkaliterrae]